MGARVPELAGLSTLDRTVEVWLATRRNGGVSALAHALSSLADRSKLWVGIGALRAIGGGRRGRVLAVRALAAVAVESALIQVIVKPVFDRDRPVANVALRFGARRPPSSSFPSGHAASASCAALLLANGDRDWTAVLSLLAVAVAWSRVQTGLHHTTDAAGGMALGVAFGLLTRRILPVV